MKNESTFVGILTVGERLNNSRNGNPRFIINIDGKDFVAKPDAAFCYGVESLEGKMVRATIGTHYGKATIADAEPMSNEDLLAYYAFKD